MVLVKYVKLTKYLKQNLSLEHKVAHLLIEIPAFKKTENYVLCTTEHTNDSIPVLSGSSPQQNR